MTADRGPRWASCSGMIFFRNRYPHFGIMLQGAVACGAKTRFNAPNRVFPGTFRAAPNPCSLLKTSHVPDGDPQHRSHGDAEVPAGALVPREELFLLGVYDRDQ